MATMTRRERLMATLRGEPVDRPAVSFYEVGGFDVDPDDPDEFNVYNDPSWRPLLELAEEQTDLIRMRHAKRVPAADNPRDEFFTVEEYTEGRSRLTRRTLTVAGRTMATLERRDPDVHTAWHIEHLLKDIDDVKAYLQLPDVVFDYEPDVSEALRAEREVGEHGIVMLSTADPICQAAELFSMCDYTVFALTEQDLFSRLLDKLARPLLAFVDKAGQAFPGRLWRICGPEYAGEPYLPPNLFDKYVVRYTGPLVKVIQKHGGFARLHMHGRIRSALPKIAEMAPDGLDPIEPPPQGDVSLAEVRRDYGKDIVLFGNLESSDVENMAPDKFEEVVAAALREGTAGQGRGFVLMPSAAPYGREISPKTLANYETMVRLTASFAG